MKIRTRFVFIATFVVALAALGIAFRYIAQTYYFNPFTFNRDVVTYAPWRDYKNPMQLDIVYQPVEGTQTFYRTNSRTEINYVLSQLKAAKPTSYKSVSDRPSGQIWVSFRNPVSGMDYIDAVFHNNMTVDLLYQQKPVTVTDGLRHFIEQKESRSKAM